MDYEVIIAGGSVSGLLCAREIASLGHRVLVIEEDFEIGTPEHCGGLASISGIEDLGVVPTRRTLDNKIKSALIVSPSGKSFSLDAEGQKVVVLDRRDFDKQIAHQAQNNGAEIRVKTSLKEIQDDGVLTTDGELKCKIIVEDRKSTRLNSSHSRASRMPSSA